MSKGITTKDVNKGRYKRFKKNLREADKTSLEIGFFEEDKYPDGTQVAQVATYNEFGTDKAPQRSFIRSTMDANKQRYLKIEEKLLSRIGKESLAKIYETLGDKIVGDIKEKLVNFSSPRNADSTIDAKGENNPLEDTGLMRDSLKKKIKKGRG